MTFTDITAVSLDDYVGTDQELIVGYGVSSVFTVIVISNNAPSGAVFVAHITDVRFTDSGEGVEALPGFGTLQLQVQANAASTNVTIENDIGACSVFSCFSFLVLLFPLRLLQHSHSLCLLVVRPKRDSSCNACMPLMYL